MEIRIWHYYLIVNFVLIQYLEAKTFSLNEAIAAESEQKQILVTPPLQENTVRQQSSKKRIAPSVLKLGINRERANKLSKISPLKYRKTFQIRSPLKPRKLKIPIDLRHKRRNQSVKREINGNEKLKQKYIPLLKSLSMLFDDLLNSDTSESFEVKTAKYKRHRYQFDSQEASGENCECDQDQKPFSNFAESRPQEKAIVPTPPISTKISINAKDFTTTKTTPAPSYYTSSPNFGRLRQNKNVSILFPRNTFSSQRDHNGVSERSSTAYNRNSEGNITGDNGNRKHNARFRKIELNTESNEENTYDSSRVNASGDGYSRGIHGAGDFARNPNDRTTSYQIVSEIESAFDDFGENKFEIGRNKTKSAKPISESIRRLRGFIPKSEISNITDSVQSEEIRKENNVNVTIFNADDKRIASRSSSSAAEDQEIGTGDETVTAFAIKTTSNSKQSKTKNPVVMIFDGYSMTRDKNGENRLAGKSIRLRS